MPVRSRVNLDIKSQSQAEMADMRAEEILPKAYRAGEGVCHGPLESVQMCSLFQK